MAFEIESDPFGTRKPQIYLEPALTEHPGQRAESYFRVKKWKQSDDQSGDSKGNESETG